MKAMKNWKLKIENERTTPSASPSTPTLYTHLLERDSILAPPLFIEEVAAKQTEEFVAM